MLVIEVRIKYENEPDSEMKFEGSKKQCVEWLNRYYQLYSLKAMFKKVILIKISDNDWSSISKYINKGRIII